MPKFPNAVFLLVLLLVLASGGCQSLKNLFRKRDPAPPNLLPVTTQPLTLEQITTAINRSSMAIRTMSTEEASVMVPGILWPVKAMIAFERPNRLRIQGGATTLTGREIDFGSNESLFWLWVRRLPEKEMYYCRHDQFPNCPVRSMFPIEPSWLIEALGIVEFSPSELHEGPFPTEDGNLMIVSHRQTSTGRFSKRTIVGGKTGWVLRQEMYSPQNELVAIALSSDHRYDTKTGIVYARKVEVQCQGAEGKMTIDLGVPTFNSQTPFPAAMFTMPNYDGYRPVDICGPEFLQNRVGGIPLSSTTPQPATGNTSTGIPLSTTVPPSVMTASGTTIIPDNTAHNAPQPNPQPNYYYTDSATPEANIETLIR